MGERWSLTPFAKQSREKQLNNAFKKKFLGHSSLSVMTNFPDFGFLLFMNF